MGKAKKKRAVKVRKTWAIKPVTRTHRDAKKYDRKREKRLSLDEL